MSISGGVKVKTWGRIIETGRTLRSTPIMLLKSQYDEAVFTL